MHDPIKEKVYIGRWLRPMKNMAVRHPAEFKKKFPSAVRVCLLVTFLLSLLHAQ
jgi:hypothetical protein